MSELAPEPKFPICEIACTEGQCIKDALVKNIRARLASPESMTESTSYEIAELARTCRDFNQDMEAGYLLS